MNVAAMIGGLAGFAIIVLTTVFLAVRVCGCECSGGEIHNSRSSGVSVTYTASQGIPISISPA